MSDSIVIETDYVEGNTDNEEIDFKPYEKPSKTRLSKFCPLITAVVVFIPLRSIGDRRCCLSVVEDNFVKNCC